MTTNMSFLSLLFDASFVVRCVILILLISSIASWTVIVERVRFYKKQWQDMKEFETRFWSGVSLNELYQSLPESPIGLSKIFSSGFKAYNQFQQSSHPSKEDMVIAAERAMQVEETKSIDSLESSLSLLTTVGTVSPFIGLFGTVWGVMTAFQALGTAQQASIAMVAPGISEALITTAIGLFAAIPAVIACNRFGHQVNRFQNQYENFKTEFTNILHRQALSKSGEAS